MSIGGLLLTFCTEVVKIIKKGRSLDMISTGLTVAPDEGSVMEFGEKPDLRCLHFFLLEPNEPVPLEVNIPELLIRTCLPNDRPN